MIKAAFVHSNDPLTYQHTMPIVALVFKAEEQVRHHGKFRKPNSSLQLRKYANSRLRYKRMVTIIKHDNGQPLGAFITRYVQNTPEAIE